MRAAVLGIVAVYKPAAIARDYLAARGHERAQLARKLLVDLEIVRQYDQLVLIQRHGAVQYIELYRQLLKQLRRAHYRVGHAAFTQIAFGGHKRDLGQRC